MPKLFKKLIFVLVFSLPVFNILYSIFQASPARAAISACSVSVSSHSLSTEASEGLVFSITNNDSSNPIRYLKVIAPSSDFQITYITGPYEDGLSINESGTEVVLKLTGLPAGESQDYPVSLTTGSVAVVSGPFSVTVADNINGTDAVSCSGNTSVSITGTEPISNLVASVTSSTATITWVTADLTTGTVDYGATTSYGSTASESTPTTSHSVTLTGLSTSTAYHFRVTITDSNSNSTQSSDSSFTTTAPGTTTTTTVTNTVTTIVTPKVIVDTTPPGVLITTSFDKPFTVAPEIVGKATDASRIVKVEYSVDGGANWQGIENPNLGDKSVGFSFTPDIFDDGNYKIQIRAMDGAGNFGKSKVYNLVIDRLPPHVGGNIWSVGPISILPDVNGVVTLLAGVDHKITMSAVGGPVSVDIIVGTDVYSMIKSADSGLWSGVVGFKSPGKYIVKVKSVDGAGNVTTRNLNTIMVINSGKITQKETGDVVLGANVKVYQQDALSKIWSLWDALSFGQINPQLIGQDGNYSYLLPAGTYYLTVTAPAYKEVTSKIFTVTTPTAINTDIVLTKGWLVNPFDSINITVNKDKLSINEQNISSLIDEDSPMFTLRSISEKDVSSVSLRGKSRIFVFVNTWLPSANEQISQIKNLPKEYQDRVVVIMEQENLSKIAIFAKKGGYDDLLILVDPDGILIDPYKINSLPSSYFTNRKGVFQKITTGVTSSTDIMTILDSI